MAIGRKPKDTSKYLHPLIAGTQLINTALEHILWMRHGTRVRWELKVSYWHDETFKPGEKQVVVSTGFTCSSGDDSPKLENILTGSNRPLPAEEPEPETSEVEQ